VKVAAGTIETAAERARRLLLAAKKESSAENLLLGNLKTGLASRVDKKNASQVVVAAAQWKWVTWIGAWRKAQHEWLHACIKTMRLFTLMTGVLSSSSVIMCISSI